MRKNPIALVILDGFGLRDERAGKRSRHWRVNRIMIDFGTNIHIRH